MSHVVFGSLSFPRPTHISVPRPQLKKINSAYPGLIIGSPYSMNDGISMSLNIVWIRPLLLK